MTDRLTELRSQVEIKQREADAMLAKDAPDLDGAEKLVTEITGLCREIDEINERATKAAELRKTLASRQSYLSEPQRTLPFSATAAARGTDLDSDRIISAWRMDSIKSLPAEIKARHPELSIYAQPRGECKSEVDKLADTGGFASCGAFARALYAKGRDGMANGSLVDQLRRWKSIQPELAVKESRELEALGFKAPSGQFEDSDPDGGDLVPREFSNQIYVRMLNQGQILSYLTVLPVMGNTLTVPALKEDSRVDGSRQGGLLAYWEGEADQYTKTKPQWRNISGRLKKLTVLSYVTEELLNDSPNAIDNWLGNRVPMEINFKINDAVINGQGGGMPTGIMKSGSKITATAVSGQGANTIVAKNVLAMYKRVVYSQRNSVIWLYNQEAEDQLFALYQPTGTTSGVLFFAPNTDQTGFRLMGKPSLVCEQCQALGTEGDFIAFATDGYFAMSKSGIQSFMSMHLRFDYDEFCYKWRFRFDGRPYDDVALTPYKGTATVSSIVTLNSTRT